MSNTPAIPRNDIDGLTGIRGLAAMMVLVFHLFSLAGIRELSIDVGSLHIPYQWLLTCGWMGANVFFVLSGFLLAIPFVKQLSGSSRRVEILPYIWRRVRRVVPAYWVQIFILLIVLYFNGVTVGWNVIAAHLAFLQNFHIAYLSILNGVYWTLPTEFGYYLLLPLFALLPLLLPQKKSAVWLLLSLTLVASAMAYRVLMYASVENAPIPTKAFTLLQLPGMLDQFAIGMALAWVYVRYENLRTTPTANALLVLGLLGFATMMILIDRVKYIYWDAHILLFISYTITASFIGLIVLATALEGSWANKLFANRVMVALGTVSYSLYLWHLPILDWTMKWLDHAGVSGERFWLLSIIAIPLSLIAATLSYYLIERPAMKLSCRVLL